jgi:uncharacterized membrane protein
MHNIAAVGGRQLAIASVTQYDGALITLEKGSDMQAIVPQQRIALIDALRGYALMGLFLIHMVEYYELYWAQPIPNGVNTTMFFLFGGKAYAMFGLLFGVSFYILMEGQARRGVDFRARFVWRLTILLAIGFLHSLIYGGDILTVLAVTGMILVPMYRWRNASLLFAALFFVLQGPLLILQAAGFGCAVAQPVSRAPPIPQIQGTRYRPPDAILATKRPRHRPLVGRRWSCDTDHLLDMKQNGSLTDNDREGLP